jgi:quinol monooxygenase YgiN
MSFLQIVSYRTDHADRIAQLDLEWRAATHGRNHLLADHVYVDRQDPRHHVVLNEFADADSAAANSAMPETSAFAEEAATLVDGDIDYTDLELVLEGDVRHALAAAARREWEVSEATRSVFSDDVDGVGLWPHEVVHMRGRDVLAAGLAAEAPGRTFEQWDVTVTETGFAAEYRYRTHGATSLLSVGVVLATVTAGRISRIVITCGGSWTADDEARIFAQTAGVPA